MPVRESFPTLIKVSHRNLKAAKLLANIDDPEIELACYLCQQCSETSLKAFLDFHGIEYKFTHDLERLCNDCIEIDKSFTTILNPCLILTYYSSDIRYLDDGLISERDMHEAIELAEEVLEFVKVKCSKPINDQNH